MDIFSESDYRIILRRSVEEKKEMDTNTNFQFLAEKTRIPKSYISKVVTGKAHFNADQLYSICELLDFDQDKIEYLSLLLEEERSTCLSRKRILKEKIKEIRTKNMDSKKHLKADDRSLDARKLTDYYIDPLNQVVHICLSLAKYQRDPKRLAQDLYYPVEEIMKVLKRLESMEIIAWRDGRYETLIKKIHLSQDNSIYGAWRNQTKLVSLERLGRFPKKEDYSFSVSFSSNEECRLKIQSAFLEFLQKVETWVDGSKLEEAYQLNFDLFTWTR